MSPLAEQTSLTPWLQKMIHIHDIFIAHGDETNAKKVRQLLEKTAKRELVIAFCGHFSAGKSSLINALLGEPLLPSSPIPTSANLVKVKSGKEYVRVFYRHEPPVEYDPPYNEELIRDQCKDGDAIELIEVSRQTPRIPGGIVMMDTPGIDSTDDAHRLATESALHLADVVFYMMDYNHVKSELNFQFTKDLTNHGKTLYLIVNQIDKHREQELPFHTFRQSVEEAFRDWGVKAERVFFISLKEPDHPYNEWNELAHCMHALFRDKDGRLLYGVETALKRLVDEHVRWLKEQDEEHEQALQMRLSELGGTGVEEEAARESLARLQAELEELDTALHQLEEDFRRELDGILEHAYIMPFETRELAKAYLQSMQPDFKIGFFFAKSKTEQEREKRLQAFYENVKEKAMAQIEWHVRQLFTRFSKEHAIDDHELLRDCQQWTVTWEAEMLANLVKKGAGVTGEAVLNYTNDVAYEMKKRYRNAAMQLFAALLEKWKEQAEEKRRQLKEQLAVEAEKYELLCELSCRSVERKQRRQELMNLLESECSEEDIDEKRLAELTESPVIRKQQHKAAALASKQTEEKQPPSVSEQALDRQSGSSRKKVQQAVQHLKAAAKTIETIGIMNRFVSPLIEKANRLQHRAFTVALFGAFSAGKSSFANALMGERLLPSSPNPTTATINKIAPPTEVNPHGTALVQVKSSKQLFSDIQASLRHFQQEAETWEEAWAMCQKIANLEKVEPHQKPHYAFLCAVLSGYERMKEQLGHTFRIGLDEFYQYVADEATACFIEWVELYYDCALTRQGITLVDTPGADSINARHTGVAFDYIKNADAVLFVTYYNHAFSKADREFLIQLGRVKDTFALDKMFFVVNAADLARSKEELDAVLAYMKDQLARFGIRFPRLYALSSRFALEEKMGGVKGQYGFLTESGIGAFEKDFMRFIIEELMEVAIQGAYAEIERAHQTIVEYIHAAQKSGEEKAAKRQALLEEQAKMHDILGKITAEHDWQALIQETDELVYYVKQRVLLRLNDWFKEAFNPASLRDDGRDIRRALNMCLEELLHSVGFDLAQEMRATSLRVEKFLKERLQDQFTDACKKLEQIHPGMPLSDLEAVSFVTPEFDNGLEHIDRSRFAKALSMYKNAKSFFERDEKRLMKEEIEKQLQQPIDEYLAAQKQQLLSAYEGQYKAVIEELVALLTHQVDDHFAGLYTALTDALDIEQLHQCAAQLARILEERG
ncbi:dynamin family protein [Saccharococcus caldoxylosilyticus]|uniref:dynamin family protein n=1 Tax=Saccharococcus caldoxylosilyticus TaxID=81408 RepID=UPI001C4E068B|nr:dynamin family protein [Parageobacillus caldoxylosilyticus]QXJ36908.1 GTPase Era [Parageobacillus caldoxylosilyticus]